ncbi:MAG: hypothetical protein ACLQPD_35245 [Desulfomonilaceae bacterium]
MKKNIHDEKSPEERKVLLGFWVEEILGNQLKDTAWSQRKTLSALLREYCGAALTRESKAKGQRRDLIKKYKSSIRNENLPDVKED